jgi:hypothetical protein
MEPQATAAAAFFGMVKAGLFSRHSVALTRFTF